MKKKEKGKRGKKKKGKMYFLFLFIFSSLFLPLSPLPPLPLSSPSLFPLSSPSSLSLSPLPLSSLLGLLYCHSQRMTDERAREIPWALLASVLSVVDLRNCHLTLFPLGLTYCEKYLIQFLFFSFFSFFCLLIFKIIIFLTPFPLFSSSLSLD